MAKPVARFVCQACGAITPKWAGRCEACDEWNTIIEEAVEAGPGLAKAKPNSGRKIEFVDLAGSAAPPPRAPSGIAELDRVLGGGLVAGSAVLLAGDPGIGKSTLLLQAAASLAQSGRRVLYISGEEAVEQVRLRARRLGLQGAKLELAASINLRDIAAGLERADDAALVVINSIQTMWMDSINSAPGTVSQVRACSFELIRLAKTRNFSVVLVGHVTKEGAIAGPRVLEHMVDAVLYFEGDRGHQFRILRGVKNRFGATDEIGVFEMTDRGLANRQSLGVVPGRAAGEYLGFGGVRGVGGVAAGAGGDPVPVGRQSGRLAAPLGHRLGWRAAVHAAGGAGNAVRAAAECDRRLSERGGRVAGG